jgi:hypothetical protein
MKPAAANSRVCVVTAWAVHVVFMLVASCSAGAMPRYVWKVAGFGL